MPTESKTIFFSESEAFLGADGTSAGIFGHDDEEEESKPMTRQVLLDKIRQKKEVIGKLRCQPWSMSRKRRTLRFASLFFYCFAVFLTTISTTDFCTITTITNAVKVLFLQFLKSN